MATMEIVEARAPGKVIISGEHAVVHGTPAVAAALDRYTHVVLKRPRAVVGELGVLTVDLPEIQLRRSWRVQYIKQSLDVPLTEKDTRETSEVESFKTVVEDFVKREIPPNDERGEIPALTAFVFLYASIVGYQPLEATITSELPIGSGLGSSAAFCVASAAALLTFAGKAELQADELTGKWKELVDTGRNSVNTWAFEAEKIIHGRPSGVDNTVSCYGHVVRFKKGHLTHLHNPMQLRMLITNTNVSRNTKALVASVAQRADRHPSAMAAVFQAVEAIVEEIVTILDSSNSDANIRQEATTESEVEEIGAGLLDRMPLNESIHDAPIPKKAQELSRLEELMVMNQGLLQTMGVSHPAIEEICQITSRFDLFSKLTGAGGGGCVITLVPKGTSPTTIQNVKSQLELSGYFCFEAGIGGTGVQVGHTSSPLPDL